MLFKSNYYDVIVVGLGAMGSATLYQLTEISQLKQKKLKILGLDQHTPPHEQGSSHGGSRLTRLSAGENEDYRFTVKRSNELWSIIEAKTQGKFGRLHQISGGLIIGLSEEDGFLQKTVAFSKKYDINFRSLTAHELKQEFPQFKSISRDFIGYYEKSMGILAPEACIRAQLELAIQNGADVHTQEKFLNFDKLNQGTVRVCTDKNEYHTDKLVLTAGPWIAELLEPQYAKSFKISRQVSYWFEVEDNALSQFTIGQFPATMWFLHDQSLFYGFPSSDGLIKLSHESCTLWPSVNMNTNTQTSEKTYCSLADKVEHVDREVSLDEKHFFYENYIKPNLRGISNRCRYAKVCLYTCTPRLRFIIDFLPGYQEQVIVASPCSGKGFKHSAAIGEALARRILDLDYSIDIIKLFGNWAENHKQIQPAN